MTQKQRYKAKIAGKEYVIVGQRSRQHMNAVVDLLNGQLEQLAELTPELSVADRSILMAINALSDQLVQERRLADLETQVQELEGQLDQKKTSPIQKNQTNSSSVQGTLDMTKFTDRSQD